MLLNICLFWDAKADSLTSFTVIILLIFSPHKPRNKSVSCRCYYAFTHGSFAFWINFQPKAGLIPSQPNEHCCAQWYVHKIMSAVLKYFVGNVHGEQKNLGLLWSVLSQFEE